MNEYLKNLTVEVSDSEVEKMIRTIPEHFSANLVVDLGNTCNFQGSLYVLSGQARVIGQIVDMLNADTQAQIYVAGFGSGPIPIFVQSSPDTTSGNFTDPTSGLAAFPSVIVSGGIFWANSGLWASGGLSPSSAVSGAPLFCSGSIAFASFQCPNRYARLIYDSGNATIAGVPVNAGFIANKRTTGSGGGFSYSPTGGSVNV